MVFAYEHLLSIPPLISPPWGFVNLLPRVILSCAVHRDNFLILPVPRQSSDSFVSIVREIVYRTIKRDPDGFRNSTRYECLKCGWGWESCFFASLLGPNEDWNKRRQLIAPLLDRRFIRRWKKIWEESNDGISWHEKDYLIYFYISSTCLKKLFFSS